MIEAAQIRALMSQIESYNTAVNAFRAKYDVLPGDLPPSAAAQFGFNPRSGAANAGDNNGFITGYHGYIESSGTEPQCFWMDLQMAGLISTTVNNTCPGPVLLGPPSLATYFPSSKWPSGTYVHVGYQINMPDFPPGHYFWVGYIIVAWDVPGLGQLFTGPSITPVQMQAIDNKYDEGTPRGGQILYGDAIVLPSAIESVPAAPSPTRCTDAVNPNIYNVSFPASVTCNMMIKAAF